MIDKKTFIKNFKSVHYNLPIGAVATSLGATTLSNIYALREFVYLKDIFMNIAAIVAIFALIKLLYYPDAVRKELKLPVLASFFPTFGMLVMILGSYYANFQYEIGKTIWIIGIVIYFAISFLVIYRHMIQSFNFDLFMPSFFIPFVGSMVACVCGSAMDAPIIKSVIFYYGLITYFILLPFIIYRLSKGGIEKQIYPTTIIMAAPPSLVIISYLNVFETYNIYFVIFMILIVLCMVLYAYRQIPKILKGKFHVGFASLTFPLAASTLATFRVSMCLMDVNSTFANVLEAIGTVEFFVATSAIGFVMYNLFRLLFTRLSMQDAIE